MNKNEVSSPVDRRPLLLLGDLIALALFIYIGEVEHGLLETYNPIVRVGVQALALAVTWLPLAWWLGAYPRSSVSTWRDMGLFLLRSLVVWLYAAPLGLVIRAWIYGEATILMLFVNAALPFGGLIMLVWRALFALIWLRKRGDRSATVTHHSQTT